VDVPSEATVAWTVGGAEAVAEGGLNNPSIVLRFKPETVELRAAPAVPTNARVRATITLGGTSRVVETVVGVLPLRIPSLLALFRNPSFSAADYGAALLVVPANSPLSSVRGVVSAVQQLHANAERLSVFPSFAALAGRLATLVGALRAHEHMAFASTDALADLGEHTLIPRGVLADAITAEDEVSSAILLGPATRQARLFLHRGFDQRGGELDISVGEENIVLLADLGSTETVPPGRAQVIVAPTRRRSFDDDLSSVQLVKPPTYATLAGSAIS
jgi:hypothetical protein